MRFSESFKQIPVIEPKDYGSAGIDGDSVDMRLLHSVCFNITFGAITGNSVLKFYSGASTGTKTTALAFKYRLSDADYKASGADGYGDLTSNAAAGLTLTATSYDHRTLIVEFDAGDMTDGEEWLTVEIDSTATVMLVACVGIGDPRYASHDGPSVIA